MLNLKILNSTLVLTHFNNVKISFQSSNPLKNTQNVLIFVFFYHPPPIKERRRTFFTKFTYLERVLIMGGEKRATILLQET